MGKNSIIDLGGEWFLLQAGQSSLQLQSSGGMYSVSGVLTMDSSGTLSEGVFKVSSKFRPQLIQNFASGGFTVPQTGQASACFSRAKPHSMQKRASSGFSV